MDVHSFRIPEKSRTGLHREHESAGEMVEPDRPAAGSGHTHPQEEQACNAVLTQHGKRKKSFLVVSGNAHAQRVTA